VANQELAKVDHADVCVGKFQLATILAEQLWKSDELAKVANVLFPVTALDVIPALHRPTLSVIMVDTSEKSKDTYYITSDQRGLSKPVIQRMLAVSGAQCLTEKLTPDSDLDFIRWTAVVWGKLPDGTMHNARGSKTWAWEKSLEQFIAKALDKSKPPETPEQAKARGVKAAQQYREFADEQTETKALLRAARGFLGIKTSYSPEELKKPFLIAKSVLDLPMDDPEIKRMVAQKAIDSTFALYGQPDAAPSLPPAVLPPISAEPDPSEFEEEGEPIDARFAVGQPEDESFDPFAEDANAGSTISEEELNCRLTALAQSPANGGIGVKMKDVLAEIGLKSLTGVPYEVKIDILHRALKVKEAQS
jgi:hypothetical protein